MLYSADDSRKTRELLEFDKRKFRTLTGILMGHCAIENIADNLGIGHQIS